MKLWVDDIRNAPDDSWTIVRTVSSAIRAMHHWTPAIVSLDHDISHQVSLDGNSRPYACAERFQAVAYYMIAKYTGDDKPKVILHTSNRVAGDEMYELLTQAGFEAEKKYMGAVNRLEMEL